MKADDVKRMGRVRRAIAGRSLDITVAATGFLVFVFFLFLLGRWLFPTGISLKEETAGQAPDAAGQTRRHELSYSGQDGVEAFVATVVAITRNVQTKGREDIAWNGASEGESLSGHDSLQTQRNSGATVRMADDSLLRIGSNSLIVFQGGVTDTFTRRRTNSVVMMSGSLGAEFASAGGDPLHLEVALPNGLARFMPGDTDASVAFNIHVNPDLSSSVSVHSGTGVVTVGGHTATVGADSAITISINGEVLEEGGLPGRPTGATPRDSIVYRYRTVPPPIGFSWNAVPRADRYRLRVARDPEMNDIVIDEQLAGPRFDYAGLRDGDYYWQVSAMAGFGEGQPTGPQRISLVRDRDPPALELQAPEIVAGMGAVLVRGRSDRHARVYIQGQPIDTAAGQFEHRLPIDTGTTLIVVEAIDDAGNVAYDSQIVNTNTSAINGGGR